MSFKKLALILVAVYLVLSLGQFLGLAPGGQLILLGIVSYMYYRYKTAGRREKEKREREKSEEQRERERREQQRREEEERLRKNREECLEKDPILQEQYAFCLEHGRGVEQNLSEALKWYERAASAGSYSAEKSCAHAYASGYAGEKNKKIALYHYHRAICRSQDHQEIKALWDEMHTLLPWTRHYTNVNMLEIGIKHPFEDTPEAYFRIAQSNLDKLWKMYDDGSKDAVTCRDMLTACLCSLADLQVVPAMRQAELEGFCHHAPNGLRSLLMAGAENSDLNAIYLFHNYVYLSCNPCRGQDANLAKKYRAIGVEQGYPPVMAAEAEYLLYLRGRPAPQEAAQAEALLRRAYEAGNAKAAYLLANYLDQCHAIRKLKYWKMIEESANGGCREAAFVYAGYLKETDPDRSHQYYLIAAEDGLLDAIHVLAYSPQGCYDRNRHWLEVLAFRGDFAAVAELSRFLLRQHHPEEALEWAMRTADSSLVDACQQAVREKEELERCRAERAEQEAKEAAHQAYLAERYERRREENLHKAWLNAMMGDDYQAAHYIAKADPKAVKENMLLKHELQKHAHDIDSDLEEDKLW